MMLYLIHFDRPFGHARHYLGWTLDSDVSLAKRIRTHRAGRGSKLMRSVTKSGIPWRVVVTFHGDRSAESRLKSHGRHTRLCPVCCQAKGVKPYCPSFVEVASANGYTEVPE